MLLLFLLIHKHKTTRTFNKTATTKTESFLRSSAGGNQTTAHRPHLARRPV